MSWLLIFFSAWTGDWSGSLRNSDQPVAITTNPPPTCTTGIDIPKKFSMWLPISIEPSKSQLLFSAILRARIARALVEYPGVKLRKIGVLPSGLTIGNSADKTTRLLFKISQTVLAGMNIQHKPSRGARCYSENASLPYF